MLRRFRFEILAIIAILVFSALFLSVRNAQFAGSDDMGSAQISKMTGIPENQFHPLVWQWVPPSSEVESGLFAIQGAVGGIIVGWFFGYWKGLKGRE